MNFPPTTCPICQKLRGGINGVNHAKCAKQMQEMNKDKERKLAKKMTVKRADKLASLILRTTA